MTLNHFTIQSGHNRVSPSYEVKVDIKSHLKKLVREKTVVPGFPGFFARGKVTGNTLVVSVFAHHEEIVRFAVSATDDADSTKSYQELVSVETITMFGLTPPLSPPPAPRCCAALLPAAQAYLMDLFWIADYERVVAWTWLKSR